MIYDNVNKICFIFYAADFPLEITPSLPKIYLEERRKREMSRAHIPPTTATMNISPTLPITWAEVRSSLTDISDRRYKLVCFLSTFSILLMFLTNSLRSSSVKFAIVLQAQVSVPQKFAFNGSVVNCEWSSLVSVAFTVANSFVSVVSVSFTVANSFVSVDNKEDSVVVCCSVLNKKIFFLVYLISTKQGSSDLVQNIKCEASPI